MYSPFSLGLKYLYYYLTASNGKGHGIHSPFVFEFTKRVLNDTRQFYAYEPIEDLRNQLQKDQRSILVEDFGAGSRKTASSQRIVSAIAKASLKPKKYGQLLFRMVDFYKPTHILELGTSLGITSSYLAMANENAFLTTMEGASTVADIARENFQKLGIKNARLIEGNFDHTLPEWLKEKPTIDLAFIDGNHRFEPTVNYFNQLLPHLHEHSILIFDDIHWSREMEQAWYEIKKHEAVTLSIDLFFIGIVLFKKDFHVKQAITIRF